MADARDPASPRLPLDIFSRDPLAVMILGEYVERIAPAGDSQPRKAASTTTAKGGAAFGLSLGLSLKALFNHNDGVAVSSGEYTFYGNCLDVTVGLPPSEQEVKKIAATCY